MFIGPMTSPSQTPRGQLWRYKCCWVSKDSVADAPQHGPSRLATSILDIIGKRPSVKWLGLQALPSMESDNEDQCDGSVSHAESFCSMGSRM